MRNLVLLVGCLAARIASADDGLTAEAARSADPATAPGFVLIDRFDADGRLGFDFAYVPARSDTYGRFDAHVHYVDPTSHLGGYAQIQHWNVLGQPGDALEDDAGTGAPELGALYISRVRETTSLVYRAGVALPTTPMSYRADAQASRPTDLYQHLDNSTVARLGVSMLVRSGTTFFRGDVGLDAAVYTSSDHGTFPIGVRLNAGMGTELLGSVALMFEISTLTLFERQSYEADGPSDKRLEVAMLPVPALTVRGRAAHFQPYASLSAPVLVGDLTWAATVGADISFDEY